MGARNQIIKGEYVGDCAEACNTGLRIVGTDVAINSDTITGYTEINNEMDEGSAVARGLVGGIDI